MLNISLRLIEFLFFPHSQHALKRSFEAWLAICASVTPVYCSSIFLERPFTPDVVPHLWEYGILVAVLVAAVIALWRRQVNMEERLYKLLKQEILKKRAAEDDEP